MTPSSACLKLVMEFESFRARPYLCPAGVPTIGYGSTRYSDGRKVALTDPVLPEPAARILLQHALVREVGPGVLGLLTRPVKQHQFDALCSFAYNLGLPNLSASTLMKLVNRGDDTAAADEFLKWTKARVGGVLKVLPGLVRRRDAEKRLYLENA